jgi:GntR family transcriptional regulator, transcriptional repressor for pyruvate dehydrogenase complex
MTSTRIQRANMYELVADRLMQEIVSQKLRPGDAIPTERELSELYGVGRSSVREGLRMLESHGVVRSTGQAQFVVGDYGELLVPSLQMLVSLGQANLAQVTSLRAILEVEAAALAAANRTQQDLAELAAACDEFEQVLTDNPDAVLDVDLAFHMSVAKCSKNNALVAATVGVRGAVEWLLARAFRPMDEAAPQHRSIVAAIADGDELRARAEMSQHMAWIAETLPPSQATSAPIWSNAGAATRRDVIQ